MDFDQKQLVEFDDFDEEIKNTLNEWFKDGFYEIDECTFYTTSLRSEDGIVALPFTNFDMRGDGDVEVFWKHLINLNMIREDSFYSVGVFLCKKIDVKNPSYAFYNLDNYEIIVLKIN